MTRFVVLVAVLMECSVVWGAEREIFCLNFYFLELFRSILRNLIKSQYPHFFHTQGSEGLLFMVRGSYKYRKCRRLPVITRWSCSISRISVGYFRIIYDRNWFRGEVGRHVNFINGTAKTEQQHYSNKGHLFTKHVSVTSLLWLLVTALFLESAKGIEKCHKMISPDSKISTDAQL
jgi:hypothetical protein